MGTTTSNKKLYEPSVGETGWGVGSQPSVNYNFTALDNILGSSVGFTLSAVDVTLTQNQANNLSIVFTGNIIIPSVNVVFPSGVGGVWVIANFSTGGDVVLAVAGGTQTVNLGQRLGIFTVFSSGSGIYLIDGAIPPGSIQPFGGTRVPFGWHICDGSALPVSGFPALFASIGYTWGGGGGTFNVPNLTGMFIRGIGTNSNGAIGPASVGQYQADNLLSHTHTATVNDPGHTHGNRYGNSYQSGSFGAASADNTGAVSSPPNSAIIGAVTNISVTNSTVGSADSNPKNYGVLYIIKT